MFYWIKKRKWYQNVTFLFNIYFSHRIFCSFSRYFLPLFSMSIFKTKWIIVSIKKRESEEDIYTLFSYDYGKILVQKKKKWREKPLDIGYIIQCEIVTWEGKTVHKIKNVKIKSQFLYEEKEFSTINEYLRLIALVKKWTPNWLPIQEIYELLSCLHKQEKLLEEKILLWQLKILHIFWTLQPENKNPTIQKILKFISENKIDTIVKLKWIDEELKNELRKLVTV